MKQQKAPHIKEKKDMHKKGSVLVFSLLLLSIVMVIATGIATTSVLDQQGSAITDDAAVAFQLADTAAERALYKLRTEMVTTVQDVGDTCSGGVVTVADVGGLSGSKYTLSFLDDQQPAVQITDCGADTKLVRRAEAAGYMGRSVRAIQFAVSVPISPYTCNSDVFPGPLNTTEVSGRIRTLFQDINLTNVSGDELYTYDISTLFASVECDGSGCDEKDEVAQKYENAGYDTGTGTNTLQGGVVTIAQDTEYKSFSIQGSSMTLNITDAALRIDGNMSIVNKALTINVSGNVEMYVQDIALTNSDLNINMSNDSDTFTLIASDLRITNGNGLDVTGGSKAEQVIVVIADGGEMRLSSGDINGRLMIYVDGNVRAINSDIDLSAGAITAEDFDFTSTPVDIAYEACSS